MSQIRKEFEKDFIVDWKSKKLTDQTPFDMALFALKWMGERCAKEVVCANSGFEAKVYIDRIVKELL